MATMKEVAQLANTSLSTTSIVLSGRGNERHISQKTQEAIWSAASTLNYQPNVAARRLRKGSDNHIVILIFWAEDFRASMLVRFLRGLQEGLTHYSGQVELMFHFYKAGELKKTAQMLSSTFCSAAIICNTTEEDLKYLELTQFEIPIVLYNRYSTQYATVNVSDEALGVLPANHFLRHSYANYLILSSKSYFPGMEKRQHMFIETLIEHGVSPEKIHAITTNNHYADGHHKALHYLPKLNFPLAIYCTSDAIAIGAMSAVLKSQLSIPKDVSIISIGNGDPELASYVYPSLTVVELPMEKMAKSCILLVFDALAQKLKEPVSIIHDIQMIIRDSCL